LGELVFICTGDEASGSLPGKHFVAMWFIFEAVVVFADELSELLIYSL
jgi:hypothetical protein